MKLLLVEDEIHLAEALKELRLIIYLDLVTNL